MSLVSKEGNNATFILLHLSKWLFLETLKAHFRVRYSSNDKNVL